MGIKGYDKRVEDFFKKHNMYDEEIFKYLYQRTIMADYYDYYQNPAIGFNQYLDKKNNNELIDFVLCIPYPIDNITCINDVYQITHGLVAYDYLNKPYMDEIYWEVLPMFYEKLFELECSDPRVSKYLEQLYGCIDQNTEEKYKYGLYARDILLSNYDNNFEHTKKLSQELVNRYQKNNR